MNKRKTKLNGINVKNAKPCTMCGSIMGCYNTALISNENQARTHYLMACTACGFGPAQAFTTELEALQHWNQCVQGEHSSAELV